MSVVPPSSPRLTRRPTRPILGRGNSFSRQLAGSSRAPVPPSLLHSPYLEDPHSIFNAGAGVRYEKQPTPPNEHDKLCLLDTVPAATSPMNSRTPSSGSANSVDSNASASASASAMGASLSTGHSSAAFVQHARSIYVQQNPGFVVTSRRTPAPSYLPTEPPPVSSTSSNTASASSSLAARQP